jgi:hypothetical protein
MGGNLTGYNIWRLGPKGRPVAIGLAEWRDLVQRTPELRLASGDVSVVNPFTGEPMTITNYGDAEFRSGDDWVRVYFWRQGDPPLEKGEGYIHFRMITGGKPSKDPVYQLAVRLAGELGAKVFEDEA